MNNTNQNETDNFNFKSEENKQHDVEIIGEEFINRVPDNFNDQKYIVRDEPRPTNNYINPTMNPETKILYNNATTGVDFNEQALTTLHSMLQKLQQAPISAREEIYENIGLWFEDTYIDEDSDEGFKIIDYDTYVEMLNIIVDAEKYLQQ
jgi:hypothetical protein